MLKFKTHNRGVVKGQAVILLLKKKLSEIAMVYPSKWSNAIALFAQMNWGVQVLALEPPFFLGEQKGKKITFQGIILKDYRGKLSIDVNPNTDYLCLAFDNKPGANLVLLRTKEVYDIVSKPFEVSAIVNYIRLKDTVEIEHERDTL